LHRRTKDHDALNSGKHMRKVVPWLNRTTAVPNPVWDWSRLWCRGSKDEDARWSAWV